MYVYYMYAAVQETNRECWPYCSVSHLCASAGLPLMARFILSWWPGDQESFVSHPTHTLCQLSHISLGQESLLRLELQVDMSCYM